MAQETGDGELLGICFYHLRPSHMSIGNLVKRPFLLLPDGRGTTGFKVEEWEALMEKADR